MVRLFQGNLNTVYFKGKGTKLREQDIDALCGLDLQDIWPSDEENEAVPLSANSDSVSKEKKSPSNKKNVDPFWGLDLEDVDCAGFA